MKFGNRIQKIVMRTIGLALVALAMGRGVIAADSDSEKVKALFATKCLSCHNADEPKGSLDLSRHEAILKGGDSGPAVEGKSLDASPIWQRVSSDEMPPKHPLSDAEKQLIKNWIANGAEWQGGAIDPLEASSDHRAGRDWWSLQPLKRPGIPQIQGAAGRRQPVDDFVFTKLHEKSLSMSPEAAKRVLIRRLSFDLLGLPPTPEAVERFVRDDRPDAYEQLIDEFLASPHYGERWARHWLDVVRFGESNGFERDLPRANAWPYRDWVVEALNRDLPYDEFVRWQLAGDLMQPGTEDALRSVGFLVAGAHDTVVPVIDRMRAIMRQDELEDIVGTVSQTFLGLTLNCARCHDHKFDPITIKEYYQFASALSGIDHGEREFTSPAVIRQLADWKSRIEELELSLRREEEPLRELILADRAKNAGKPILAEKLPAPIAAWDFTRDLRDLVGNMHVQLVGAATQTGEGLIVDGNSYAKSARLTKNVKAKTLEVSVKLATLDQAGGGVMSLQSLDGQNFDGVVYAELEPRRWMPGSEGFFRTASFRGGAEEHADKSIVMITQVYQDDGTIIGYRNGVPYGVAIRQNDALKFDAATSHVIFGLRHGTGVGGNRMLNGTIVTARLYDRALTADEVAATASGINGSVTEAEIALKLNDANRARRQSEFDELRRLRKQHAELTKNGKQTFYTAIATQPGPMKIHKRGSVSSLGDEVEPAGLTAVRGLQAGFGLRPDAIESHRRHNLATWITDSRNPLFARVMTNRIWHYHFGAGLVETPNDMGFHAGTPSHPELLDWLAVEFQSADRRGNRDENTATDAGSFSLKRLHRLIVSSATYRQASGTNEAAAKIDASNRLLWRFAPRRLEAEEVRDAMLVVAGGLNDQIGGKGYTDLNSYFFKGTQFYDPIDPTGFVNQRRTLYRMWARGGRSPFLDNFDCPDPSTTAPRRSATVTPLQALSLLNNSFGLRMAEQFGDRLMVDAPSSAESQVRLAYRLLFSREPNAEEISPSVEFIKRRGLNAYCRAMWNTSEFLFLD